MASEGMIVVASRFGVKQAVELLEKAIAAKGMSVFARIDHAAAADAVGMTLRPTELLIFGNARAGTPLMQANQAIGIDLPLKALVYEDEAGRCRVCYNDVHWLAKRHGLDSSLAATIDAMAGALDTLMRQLQ